MEEESEGKGRGFSGGRFSTRTPIEEGKTYEVEIEGLGKKGDGIGRIENFVVIVQDTKPGDKVKVRITAVRGKVAFGDVEEML